MATLQDYYNQLGSIYDPQTALIKQQQAQLPGQFQAQKSALEQARVNAFKDISNTASSRGMTFSGFNPQQQATYVGETFLPAMANLATAEQTSQNSLIEALNKINAERSQTALGYYESAQQAEAANAAKIQAAQIEASSGSSGGGSGITTVDTSKFKAVPNEATGGFNFYNNVGAPITAAQFYTATAGDNAWSALKSFLRNDENKNPYQYMDYVDKAIDDGRMTEDQGWGFLQSKFPWIFG